MNTDLHFSSASSDWATPQDFFDEVEKRFGRLDLDVCATAENAKCEDYFDLELDGLKQPWAPKDCWLNPPYGRGIGAWMAKAAVEADKGAVVIALVPARTDTKWFRAAYEKASYLYLISGRLKFGGCENAAPFPSALFLFESCTIEECCQVRYW